MQMVCIKLGCCFVGFVLPLVSLLLFFVVVVVVVVCLLFFFLFFCLL